MNTHTNKAHTGSSKAAAGNEVGKNGISLPAVPFKLNTEAENEGGKEYTKGVSPSAISNPVVQLNKDVLRWARSYGGNKEDDGNGNVYVPRGDIYPHVHINKDFVVMSQNAHNHGDMLRGSTFSKARVQLYLTDYSDPDIQAVLNQLMSDYG